MYTCSRDLITRIRSWFFFLVWTRGCGLNKFIIRAFFFKSQLRLEIAFVIAASGAQLRFVDDDIYSMTCRWRSDYAFTRYGWIMNKPTACRFGALKIHLAKCWYDFIVHWNIFVTRSSIFQNAQTRHSTARAMWRREGVSFCKFPINMP